MSFKSLVCAISEQCQEIKQALASFSYFDTWEADVVAECCRVSSVAEYPSDEIILGPNVGSSHTAHFLMEGVCRMVQNLHIEVDTNQNGEKTLGKVHRYSASKTLNPNLTNEGYSSRLFNRKRDFRTEEEVEVPTHRDEAGNGQVSNLFPGDEGESEETRPGRTEVPEPYAEGSDTRVEVNGSASGEKQARDEDLVRAEESSRGEDGSAEEPEAEGRVRRESEPEEGPTFEADHHLRILEECKRRRRETTRVCKKGRLPEKPKNVECFFVQAGFLFKGACFGLEKCQGEIFIMSTTKVKCLKIPQRFLFKHNPRYIWNRIRLFHSLYLPKDEVILDCLRDERAWIKDKRRQSEEIVSSRSIPNYTSTSEVPYSLRLSAVQ